MWRVAYARHSMRQQHPCLPYSRLSWQVLGFLTYDIIFKLHLDQIYTAPYFLGLMALLAASLAACTSTRCASGLTHECRPLALNSGSWRVEGANLCACTAYSWRGVQDRNIADPAKGELWRVSKAGLALVLQAVSSSEGREAVALCRHAAAGAQPGQRAGAASCQSGGPGQPAGGSRLPGGAFVAKHWPRCMMPVAAGRCMDPWPRQIDISGNRHTRWAIGANRNSIWSNGIHLLLSFQFDLRG